jgi:uncharacterized protein
MYHSKKDAAMDARGVYGWNKTARFIAEPAGMCNVLRTLKLTALCFGYSVSMNWPIFIDQRLIQLYKRWLSPILQQYFGVRCRFEPSCSDYAGTAMQQFGLWRGAWLTLTRLLRCQPLGTAGFDPVPAQFLWRGSRVQLHCAACEQTEKPHEH